MKNCALFVVSIISLLFCGIVFATQHIIRPSTSSTMTWFYPAVSHANENDDPDFAIDTDGLYNLELTVNQMIGSKSGCAAEIQGCELGAFVMQPGEKTICQPVDMVVYIKPVCVSNTETAGAAAGTVRFFKK